jgi:hypothetical protein
MKKIILLTILMLISGLSAFAQTVETQITAIRAEVAAINGRSAKYTTKTIAVEGVSLEGTEATFYVSGKALRKIAAKIYGESYRATLELYFQGEDLIFAYQKTSRYDMPIGSGKTPRVLATEETRSYFSGGKMIRFLKGKKQIKTDSIEFDEQAYSTMEISDTLRRAFTK